MSIENINKIQRTTLYGLITAIISIGFPIMLKVGPPIHFWLSAWGFELGMYYHELVIPLLWGKLTPLFGYWFTFILPLLILLYLNKIKRNRQKPNKKLINILLLIAMFGPYLSYIYASATTPEITKNINGNYLILLAIPIWIYLLPMPGIFLSCACILFLRAIITPVGEYVYHFKY